MSKYDVRARILKTGEERIYPEQVFLNICEDTENPLQFIEYVDLPPNDTTPFKPESPQSELHSQKLIDALLKERADKQALENRIKELESLQKPEEQAPEKKSVGRPKKEEPKEVAA